MSTTRALILFMGLLGGAAACTPTVQVQAPQEPITINLNVKLDAEVRVKVEEQAEKDIENAPDIF
ncbi:MAG: YnbE family lipoprotein [Rhodobacteraceae bacterium]|nr:YnbE family lipoprotein [Paracoccaceae bacterium]